MAFGRGFLSDHPIAHTHNAGARQRRHRIFPHGRATGPRHGRRIFFGIVGGSVVHNGTRIHRREHQHSHEFVRVRRRDAAEECVEVGMSCDRCAAKAQTSTFAGGKGGVLPPKAWRRHRKHVGSVAICSGADGTLPSETWFELVAPSMCSFGALSAVVLAVDRQTHI